MRALAHICLQRPRITEKADCPGWPARVTTSHAMSSRAPSSTPTPPLRTAIQRLMPCGSTCQKHSALAPVRTPYPYVVLPSEVATYHGITQDQSHIVEPSFPAQANSTNGRRWRRQRDPRRAGGRRDGHANISVFPAPIAHPPQQAIGRGGLQKDAVRGLVQIERRAPGGSLWCPRLTGRGWSRCK